MPIRFIRPLLTLPRLASILILVAAVLLTFAVQVSAKTEHEYQSTLCTDFERSVFIQKSGTQADCVSPELAIEIDFSGKWAEAIGQAMHYAAELKRKIGIILICKPVTSREVCTKHSYNAEETLVYWGLSADMWLCPHDAVNIVDCSHVAVSP
ncbi:hypothetical protein K1W69_18380 [Hoeflea sp. WL0058]|uniref:Uncharacterized protein n=1 Tax=Flavimaribacter sediminis TaxID=2865987 RepID=A0AAE2ZLQ0_9HYPH|nr:hypothetical protein [Flavimaribacter sediminis]MBW8639169.1 hypothetical protein [Flavimaribacter sediminis]